MNKASQPAEGSAPAFRRANLPNILTIARMVLILPLLGCFYPEAAWARPAAFVLFALAAVTDFLDGWLARRYRLQSAFGEIFDPVADKMIVIATLLLLAAWGSLGGISLAAAGAIVLRELFVSGLRELSGAEGDRVPVSKLGKWKTTAQLISLSLLLLGDAWSRIAPVTFDLGRWLLWIAALLSVYTGYRYARAVLAKPQI